MEMLILKEHMFLNFVLLVYLNYFFIDICIFTLCCHGIVLYRNYHLFLIHFNIHISIIIFHYLMWLQIKHNKTNTKMQSSQEMLMIRIQIKNTTNTTTKLRKAQIPQIPQKLVRTDRLTSPIQYMTHVTSRFPKTQIFNIVIHQCPLKTCLQPVLS